MGTCCAPQKMSIKEFEGKRRLRLFVRSEFSNSRQLRGPLGSPQIWASDTGVFLLLLLYLTAKIKNSTYGARQCSNSSSDTL